MLSGGIDLSGLKISLVLFYTKGKDLYKNKKDGLFLKELLLLKNTMDIHMMNENA